MCCSDQIWIKILLQSLYIIILLIRIASTFPILIKSFIVIFNIVAIVLVIILLVLLHVILVQHLHLLLLSQLVKTISFIMAISDHASYLIGNLIIIFNIVLEITKAINNLVLHVDHVTIFIVLLSSSYGILEIY